MPSDPSLDPIFALAEQLDVAVVIEAYKDALKARDSERWEAWKRVLGAESDLVAARWERADKQEENLRADDGSHEV